MLAFDGEEYRDTMLLPLILDDAFADRFFRMTGTTQLRATYLAAALATIGIGLLVHLRGAPLGPAARDMLGDALWAAMIVWWTGVFAPRTRLSARAAAAYALCVAVEVSQLYHTPALDAIRATRAGHLVLGSGFDARDLLAYAAGVAVAALVEAAVRHRV
jgi:hypothetical protein